MYYFECCNKLEGQTGHQNLERHIFSTVQGHKVVGSRGFEFDGKFVDFLELFFSVSFHSSLPQVGKAKPPALVATNKKILEQIYFDKNSLSFSADKDTLESFLHTHSQGNKQEVSLPGLLWACL